MWFLLAAGSAFCDSIRDLLSKKSSSHIDEYVVIFQMRLFALILLLPLMLLNIPTHFDSGIWIPFGIVLLLDTVASIFYIKALKKSPISLVAPITSLTPVAILITSLLINGELPNTSGIIGVVLSAIGIYVLRFSKYKEGFLEPFLLLGREIGPRLMLGVVICWSITSSYDKTLVQMTNPFFYTGLASIGYTIILFLILLKRNIPMKAIFGNTRSLFPIGLFQGTSLLLQFLALPLTFVSYVVAIKLSSGVLSVWWGKIFLKEEHIMERVVGTLIILSGVILMILS